MQSKTAKQTQRELIGSEGFESDVCSGCMVVGSVVMNIQTLHELSDVLFGGADREWSDLASKG